MFFVLSRAYDKEKILSPHEESNLWTVRTGGLRFDSSWGLRIFSLPHARDQTNNIFSYFFIELKTYYLSYSIC